MSLFELQNLVMYLNAKRMIIYNRKFKQNNKIDIKTFLGLQSFQFTAVLLLKPESGKTEAIRLANWKRIAENCRDYNITIKVFVYSCILYMHMGQRNAKNRAKEIFQRLLQNNRI